MDEPFAIPVVYKNKEYSFDAQLLASAYSYRIEVIVDEIPFYFERDDEGSFRAIAATPDDKKVGKIDADLLQAIADTIETILA